MLLCGRNRILPVMEPPPQCPALHSNTPDTTQHQKGLTMNSTKVTEQNDSTDQTHIIKDTQLHDIEKPSTKVPQKFAEAPGKNPSTAYCFFLLY